MTTAFCPGHVTAFFAIHDDAADPLARGSRGAGLSLDRGVVSHVTANPRGEGLHVLLDGAPAEAPTTRAAVRALLRGEKAVVRVASEVQLPVSQGFGMSAAGALSAALALAVELGRDPQEAVEAAHAAEVTQRTGLGDVAGALHGGLEARVAPGCPPRGRVQALPRPDPEPEVVLCTVEGPLETRRILADPDRRRRIQDAGDALVEALLAAPSAEAMLRLGRRFAVETGLATDRLRAALDAAAPHAPAAQAMLGNSVFALADPARAERVAAAWAAFGDVTRCRVAWDGPRVL